MKTGSKIKHLSLVSLCVMIYTINLFHSSSLQARAQTTPPDQANRPATPNNTTAPAPTNSTLLQSNQTTPLNQSRPTLNSTNLPNTTAITPAANNNTATNSTSALNSNSILNKDEAVPLDTKITAPFSVLGVLLIISGAPMAFWGGRNRWSSYFLTGAYLAALIVMIPILRFGVIEQDHHPSNAIQGVFVLACFISAIAAGALAVIFWKGTRFLVGACGGFVISLFILSLKSNTLIEAPGLRWVLILVGISIGFVLSTIPILAIHVTLFATAAMGAAAVVLGIDCFTTGGLKEFWLYIVGFGSLWPKLNYFPFTVTMQAELGLMAGLFLMGASVQWRLLEIIKKKINELKQLDQDRRLQEDAAAYRQSMALDADLARWEKRHGDDGDSMTMTMGVSPTNMYHSRKSSQFSMLPRASASPNPNQLTAYESVPRSPNEPLPAMEFGTGLAGSLGIADSTPNPNLQEEQLKIETLDNSPRIGTSLFDLPRKMSSEPLVGGRSRPHSTTPRATSIDFESFDHDRRVARPPGAPSSWTNPLHTSANHGLSSPSGSRAKPSPKSNQTRPLSYAPQSGGAHAHLMDERSKTTPGAQPQRPMSEYFPLSLPKHSEELNRGHDPKSKVDSKRHSEVPSRVIIGSYQPTPQRASPSKNRESKILTIEELDQRHKQAMKKLQQPTTEKVKETNTKNARYSGNYGPRDRDKRKSGVAHLGKNNQPELTPDNLELNGKTRSASSNMPTALPSPSSLTNNQTSNKHQKSTSSNGWLNY